MPCICFFVLSENRYLLFLTENYAALDILRHYLQDALSFLKDGSMDESMDEDTEPFILFGSSFPRDKEYTQVCTLYNITYNVNFVSMFSYP